MNDFIKDIALALVSALIGGLMTAAGVIFKAGKRDGELISRQELAKTLEGYARKDQVDGLKDSLSELRREQQANFGRLFDAILDIRDNGK